MAVSDTPAAPRAFRLAVGLLAALVSSACQASPQDSQAEAPGPRPLQVGFLVVDGVYNTELMAPWDVFHHTVFHTAPGMEVFTVAPSLEPVTSFEGIRLLPDYDFTSAPPIDVLVVPSAEHSLDSDLENVAMIEWVREVGGRASQLLSLCDGAFVLAEAGLLDGLECTTFPTDVAAFRERYGQLEVHEGVSFVHDGKAITSAGGALSYDAAMYLCEELYGADVTRGIGRGLCIDWDLESVPHVRGVAPR